MKYQKIVFSFFLISVLFWNTIYISLTYTYYYADQSGFIELFCENVDKPEMQCNGKCHLKDVVEKTTTNEKTPINLIAPKEITLFFEIINEIDLQSINSNRNKQHDWYFNLYSFTKEYSWYHPPQKTLLS